MKDHFRRGCWALLLVTALGCGSKPQDKKNSDAYRVTSPNLFLWEVSSDKNTIYLLGTMHIGTDELYPLPEEITDALAASKRLVIEGNPENADPVEITQYVAKHGTYQDGTLLTEHVSKETADRLRAYCKERGLPLEQINRHKPWMAEMVIIPLELTRAGYTLSKGIDTYLVRQASETGKPVDELETAREQLEMFASIPEDLHEALLLNMLQQLDDLESGLEQMISAWVNGDADRMHKLARLDPLAEEPKLKPLYTILFDDRNVKMAAKIEKYLNGSEPVFVAVGAGHIPGETGILKLLEKKGYKVKQMQRAK